MTFDELKEDWQSQPSGLKLTIDSDLILREVKRNREYFQASFILRDIGTAGIAVPMALFFLHLGLKNDVWPFFLLALLSLYMAVAMIIDRILQKRKRPKCTESLMGWVKSSLAEVDHQITVMKNVFWWYLLPANIAFAIFFGYLAWGTTREIIGTELVIILAILFGCFAFCIFVSIAGYYLHRYVVWRELNPRKQELEQLLGSLKNGDREN